MSNFRKKRSAMGFTVIELMITIVIVAILVVLAVPAYKDYSIRTKVAECINGAAVAKVGISEYRQSLGAWPGDLVEAGLDNSGISHYCTEFSDYSPATGEFVIDVNEIAVDPILTNLSPKMIPTQRTSFVIDWDCTRGATPEEDLKYLPPTCRDN